MLPTTRQSTGSYGNLELNNANCASLGASPTVNGTFTLTSGELVTGSSYQVNLAAAAAWSRNNGWVNGTLQKTFNTGSQSFTFPIGGQTAYRPVAVANLNVATAGTLAAVVSATAGNHPQSSGSGINPSHDVTRYWTLTPGGGLAVGTFGVTFTFDDKRLVREDRQFVVRQRAVTGQWSEAKNLVADPALLGRFELPELVHQFCGYRSHARKLSPPHPFRQADIPTGQ